MEAQEYLESVLAKVEAGGHNCQPIREALAPYLSEADPFDVAEALYWYSYEWHGGQRSMEYALGCCTGYTPGASQCECGPDSVASMMLAELEALHARPEGSR